MIAPARRPFLSSMVVGIALLLPATSSAAKPSSEFPYCSWWATTTPETANVAFPDSAATYWTTPFLASDGLAIEIDGTYPNARYMSFNVYDDTFGSFTTNGVESGVADYLIQPDAGSVNPFQTPGSAGGAFTVTLSGTAQPGQVNTLPLAPVGETPTEAGAPVGYLTYRVYLPTGGYQAVDLPTLTLINGPNRVTLPRCPSGTNRSVARAKPGSLRKAAKALVKQLGVPPSAAARAALKGLGKHVQKNASGSGGPCRGSACPPSLEFFRATASETDAFFPNVDNAYVSALFRPVRGEIVVVRGKAPTAPSGTSPVPWPQAGLQLRYWSLCNNIYRKPWPVVANPEPGGGVEYGCAYDDQTTLDANGNYAFVVATRSQRAAIEAAGGTFIPLSATQPRSRQLLILRNMLPNSDFNEAVQNAPQNGSPSGAAEAMGTYYPRAYRCTLKQFVTKSAECG